MRGLQREGQACGPGVPGERPLGVCFLRSETGHHGEGVSVPCEVCSSGLTTASTPYKSGDLGPRSLVSQYAQLQSGVIKLSLKGSGETGQDINSKDKDNNPCHLGAGPRPRAPGHG